uniref:Thyroid hormone receptor interactor 10 n=1 Tax=Mus musculus TaxID=10090 RepID=A0A286YEA1_MOUSE
MDWGTELWVTLTFPNRAPAIRISLRCWNATRSGGWICWTNT